MVRVRRIGVAALALAVLGLGSTLDLNVSSKEPVAQAPDGSDPFSEMRGAKVKRLYEAWLRKQEAAGGESKLVVALGRARNHTARGQRMAGTTIVDMKAGRITAEVHGLPADQQFELWLVDNVAADKGSPLPDTDDRTVLVGDLIPTGKLSKIDRQVDAGTFDRFQIDMIAVAPKGEGPGKSSVLFGSFSLFQRLYSALGSESRLLASDFSRSIKRGPAAEQPLLSVRSAHAELPIFVDADVIFDALVREGAQLFLNETFSGNGRTCGTCHPTLNNTVLDVPFIAGLEDDDPLFSAEFIPALAENFENPILMRGAGLILENLDGFGDLANRFVMRGIPHTLGLSTSMAPTNVPFDNTVPENSNFPPGFPAQRTGWGGDGSPNSGSLRDFAIGAVQQHFPLTLARVDGQDFRLPTVAELDAMEAFQLALGRQEEVDINALNLRDARAVLGRTLFTRLDTGNPPKPSVGPAPNPFPQGPPLPAAKCALCHENAGATLNVQAFTELLNNLGIPVPTVTGNANFATGVNDADNLPGDILDPENNPRDGGFGLIPHDGVTPLPQLGNVPCANPRGGFGVVTLPGGPLPPGLCEEDFNTAPLIEAADTPPFFHNNARNTIEEAATFYTTDALNNSVGGQLLKLIDTNGVGISLDATQIAAVGSFLRVLNALENIRQAVETVTGTIEGLPDLSLDEIGDLLDHAVAEVEDAIQVLEEGDLHPTAVEHLEIAADILRFFSQAGAAPEQRELLPDIASELNAARADLVDP
jgi:cytochrome c peroxidase